jgi:hypothetical protein
LTQEFEALITIRTDHYPVTIMGTNFPVGSDMHSLLVQGNKEGATYLLHPVHAVPSSD